MNIIFLIFKSHFGKYLVGASLIGVFGTGVYALGYNKGYSVGEKADTDVKQDEIDGLTNVINRGRTAVANKANDVTTYAVDSAIASEYKQETKQKERVKIVENYHTVEKFIATQCTISASTVDAINLLLDTQIVYDVNPTKENHETD